MQGFSLAKFGRALLDEARIWPDLDLAWRRKAGFSDAPTARACLAIGAMLRDAPHLSPWAATEGARASGAGSS